MSKGTMAKCPTCGYPVMAQFEGQTAVCANCGEQMEAAISQGVTIPTPLFAGGLGFLLGMLIGPALVASTDVGKRWLEKQARGLGG